MSERIFDKLEKIANKLGGSTADDKLVKDAIEAIEDAKSGTKGDAKTVGQALDQLCNAIAQDTNLLKYKAVFNKTITSFEDDNVTAVPIGAFCRCYSLSAVSFQNCTEVDRLGFVQCSSLASVSFPACEMLKAYCFMSCCELPVASFPACTYIEGQAFYGCTNLSNLYFLGPTLISLYASTAFLNTHASLSIYVPESLYSSYLTASNWSTFSSRIVSVPANS